MVESDEEGEARTPTRRPRWATAPSPRAPTRSDRGQGRAGLQGLHHRPRRDRRRRGAVRRRGADPAARLSRPAAVGPVGVVSRLANKLQRRLLAKQNRSWTFDLEEGPARRRPPDAGDRRSDRAPVLQGGGGHRVPRHGGDPADRQFRLDARPADHGGGVCADILARTLERCGVKTEILGFTTQAWKGGPVREDWIKAGKPPAPGRLNDLRHIIYKDADAPWRRARATSA
jgi:cobaltochelatase CobT